METKAREPTKNLILYYFLKWSLVSPLLHVYFRGKIYGARNIPGTGGAIIVSNHASYFDPPILANCVNRPVAFMAKSELFKVPVLKQVMSLYGAYPVNRRASDRRAIRMAMSAIERGWLVGIFLQGTRTKDAKIVNPKLGAALIAAKTGVPLIPVSLWGTEQILNSNLPIPNPTPVTIRIGDAIAPPQSTDKVELQQITARCAATINSLHSLGR
ncbi:1-acyl-sn-glycerol-3-phosphate acyltransferase [Myxosarcina sp. GI1]|uniref:lysophospholipid acyltransferase family protein n=1 Tax=Myxosarcina sp. GI1 TaxID=1541065 RepID=UPI000563DBFF|nr:lysophospholipid acyltransferase family protein [Myxosarcina sp. GI1]